MGVTVIVPWQFESVGFKLSMNPHVPLRLAMVVTNPSPGRSVGLFSSGPSTCCGSGLEASWWLHTLAVDEGDRAVP